MSATPQPPRPTLEDLLRYKRAERPSPEFWAEFDRGLRQKQLAALMKRPQGWARFRPALVGSLRWSVPAAAAVAVAFVVVQVPFSSSSHPVPVEVASQPLSVSVSAPTDAAKVTPPTAAQVALSQAAVAVVSAPEPQPAAAVANAEATQVAFAPMTLAEPSLPWSSTRLDGSQVLAFHSTRDAVASAPAPERRRTRSSWTSRFSEMVQELGADQTVERHLQLASLDISAATNQPVANASSPVAYSSAPASHLSDRAMRDLESRFGVTGSSLSVKF